MADVFTALYGFIMRHDPKRPDSDDRDRLLLSCGHIAPVRYSAMANFGYFPVEELLALRKFGSRLQGHPERVKLPALETTSGPLGEGLLQGTGMALAAKMDNKDWRVFVVHSDAEHQCGLHMEAMMTAGKFKFDNLTVIIDRNFIQIDGSTEEVMPLEPFADSIARSIGKCSNVTATTWASWSSAATRQSFQRQTASDHRPHGTGQRHKPHGRRLHLARQANKEQADTALAELAATRERLLANV